MKALGLSALIIAIIAVFVPVFGPYLTVLSAFLAAFAAGPGRKFATLGLTLNAVNVIVLSPSVWLGAGLAESYVAGVGALTLITIGVELLGAQVLGAMTLVLTQSLINRRQAAA